MNTRNIAMIDCQSTEEVADVALNPRLLLWLLEASDIRETVLQMGLKAIYTGKGTAIHCSHIPDNCDLIHKAILICMVSLRRLILK